MGTADYSEVVQLKPQGYQNQSENKQNESVPQQNPADITNEYVLNVAFWTFLGFLLLEAVFAIIAGSQSMLEDAEAMSVDAITYLFNLVAERIKNRPYSDEELEMPVAVRDYRREKFRLYLELVPPLISVGTLVLVTVFALQDSYDDLTKGSVETDEDVDVKIMLLFSGMNLLLDLVNVTCFARAHQTFGLSATVRGYDEISKYSIQDAQNSLEMDNLLNNNEEDGGTGSFRSVGLGERVVVNLNMCSAWTHVCADTLRSVSVLIAAAIAFFFESVSGALADSLAVIVVSVIILVSLIPLLHGLIITAKKIVALPPDPAGR